MTIMSSEVSERNDLPRCPRCGAPAGKDCRTIQGRMPPCHGREAALSAPPIDDEFVAWLRYHVNNPSAWQNYDEAVSELIRQAADRIAAAGEVRRKTIEALRPFASEVESIPNDMLDSDEWAAVTVGDWRRANDLYRSLSAKEDDNA